MEKSIRLAAPLLLRETKNAMDIKPLTPDEALNNLAAAKDELEAAMVELRRTEIRKAEAEHAVLRATNQLVNLAIDRQIYQMPSYEERHRSSAKSA